MDTFLTVLHTTGVVAGYVLVTALCLLGIALSCISISGTWVVLLATALAAVLKGPGFPGWWTITIFTLVSVSVELAEALAAGWGVRRRGGSRLAGLAAVAGGLAGLALGALIPVFVVGPLIGMLVGSFALAFLVEWKRLARSTQAAHIAWGTVLARVAVTLLKVTVTMGMAIALLVGLVIG